MSAIVDDLREWAGQYLEATPAGEPMMGEDKTLTLAERLKPVLLYADEAFIRSKGEWHELKVTFKIGTDGTVYLATPDLRLRTLKPDPSQAVVALSK